MKKDPLSVWRNNKHRLDLRKYTREFQKKFESKTPLKIYPGEIYTAKYLTDSSILTDKYHYTPIFATFGRFRDDYGYSYIRTLNLLYLSNDHKIQLLEDLYKQLKIKDTERAIHNIQIHEKWMKITPWCFKNIEERRIIGISLVEHNEWGMIPLLKDSLLGNFNAILLNEDFKKENKISIKKTKNNIPTKTLIEEDEKQETYEEFLNDEGIIDLDD